MWETDKVMNDYFKLLLLKLVLYDTESWGVLVVHFVWYFLLSDGNVFKKLTLWMVSRLKTNVPQKIQRTNRCLSSKSLQLSFTCSIHAGEIRGGEMVCLWKFLNGKNTVITSNGLLLYNNETLTVVANWSTKWLKSENQEALENLKCWIRCYHVR